MKSLTQHINESFESVNEAKIKLKEIKFSDLKVGMVVYGAEDDATKDDPTGPVLWKGTLAELRKNSKYKHLESDWDSDENDDDNAAKLNVVAVKTDLAEGDCLFTYDVDPSSVIAYKGFEKQD